MHQRSSRSEGCQYVKLMPLPPDILEQVIVAAGFFPDNTKDIARLAADIQAVTGRPISVTTLKRFLNRAHDGVQPSAYTLDTIARYLGKKDWKALIAGNDEAAAPAAEIGIARSAPFRHI